MAIAPMDLRKGRMRISATARSFGKAPKAVAVTAMGILMCQSNVVTWAVLPLKLASRRCSDRVLDGV